MDLRAAYTYLDARITKDTTLTTIGTQRLALNPGNTLNNTPMNSASLTAAYTFQNGKLEGFGFGGGVRYYGDTYGTNNHLFQYNDATTGILTTVSSWMPSYTLFDAAVHYDLGKLRQELKGFKVAVNASNLTDKTYVSVCSTVGCRYGIGRTVLASLTYRW